MRIKSFVARLKFQKRSALKFVSRTIPRSGGYNTPNITWGVMPVISMLVLITFLSGAFFVPNSFADSKERDEIKKAIGHKKARWTARDTKISQAPSAERKKHLGSHVPVLTTQEKILTITSATVPAQLDWRSYNGNNYVTPVKEQGACSDCWSFATTAALESNKLISSNTPGVFIDLSEQTLNSCSGAGSCNGGYIDAAANFLRDIGLPLESCNPYTATDGMCSVSCSDWLTNPYKISGWYKVNPDVEAIKYSLYNYGPVVALMAVYTDFYYYSTGVYEKSWGSFEGYHAVLIVGYDDVEQCFIIKDSWGEDWGDAGYGRIAYSEIAGDTQFGFWTIAYENAIPTGFPTQDSIPRDPNNPNTTGNQNGNSNTQLSILTGSVKDESGNAVSSAEIKIGNYKATSNAAGVYVFSSLPAGNYVATVSKTGYTTLSENMTITPSDTVTKDFVISSSATDDVPQDKKDNSKTSKAAGVLGPGWLQVRGKAISAKEAQEYLKARREKIIAAGSAKALLAGAAADISADIQELARALHYDPKLIYDYVHNNIEYVSYFGSLKGAQLTYLDGSGNDFDQASLMIALIRASSGKDANSTIYTAEYVYGQMSIPLNQLANWLNVDVSSEAVKKALEAGYIPYDPASNDPIIMDRVWVRLTIDGSAYLFDPAFKTYDNKSPIDLGTAMSYSRSTLLGQAEVGADVRNDLYYTKNLNETNIRSRLAYFTTSLANYLKNNYSNSEVKDVIGGRAIVIEDPLTELPTTDLHFSPTTTSGWPKSDIPDEYKTTLQVAVCRSDSGCTSANSEIYKSYDTADFSGRRLTIRFIANQPNLYLNGNLEPGGTGQNVSTDAYMTITIDHPYEENGTHAANYNLKIGDTNTYAIVYNFGGGISDILLKKRQKQLELDRSNGESDSSEKVLGESLNILGQSWLKQVAMSNRMLAGISQRIFLGHHNVGIVAQDEYYYIDVKQGMYDTVYKYSGDTEWLTIGKVSALILSGLEHGILEQLVGSTGAPAVSTIKLLQRANETGMKVYLVNYGTYNADGTGKYSWNAFKALFSNYKNDMNCSVTCTDCANLIPAGCVCSPTCPCSNCIATLALNISWDSDYTHTYIIPESGSIGWKDGSGNDYPIKFKGYIHVQNDSSTEAIIRMAIMDDNSPAIYDGGFSVQAITDALLTEKVYNLSTNFSELSYEPFSIETIATITPPYYSKEPVDMAGGAYTYDHNDLAFGGSIPLGLAFSRSYNSNKNLIKQTLGYGFNHNYNIYHETFSHAEPVLGSRQPVDTAGMLVAIYTCLDLIRQTENIENWMVAVLTAKWGIDQLIDNAVTINMGNKVMEYIKLADNTYVPPPGITTQLIKNGDGTFALQERFGTKMNFNSDKKISQAVDVDGNSATFTYNADKTLQKVTDAFGRTLTLTYTSGNITSIADSASPVRTVSYSYDANNNLTGYTDAEGKLWQYGYDTSHRMTTLKNPLNITTATNVYDSLDRVKTQTVPRQGGGTVTYNFYFSGYRNQEEDPNGKAITYYYDKKGREYATEDALGNKTTKTYDGQDHVIKVVDPRENETTYQYDGNNNLKIITNALNYLFENIYDTQYPFKLTDKKDALNHYTHYNYDSEYHLLDVTDAETNKAESAYYANGFKQTVKDPRLTVTTFTYDTYGNPLSSQTAAHPAITYAYDTIGRRPV